MSESKSASVVFTNSSLLAKNAQLTADSAKTAAEVAQEQAITAQKTADGKNSIYRGTNPNTVPTSGLKEGDIYFTADTLYTWNGSSWEKTVSDTTGEEIRKKVEDAMAEKDRAIAELDANIKAKVAEMDKEIEDNKIQTGNALSFYKEQYYLSTSYTELTGGDWSDEVPTKTAGKYVWSRYVTANVGDPTNQQYSAPVCISGLDGPQGPKGESSYTHIAYSNSSDGRSGFDVSNGEGKTYIGIYVDSNPTDSTDPTKYTWTLIKGKDGADGLPGPKGADGRTPYFHVAYANSADGTIGFDVINSDGKLYIGTYTDYTQADSTNPASYAWIKIKGDTGATGPQGPKGDTGDTGFFIGTTPPSNPAVGTVWATNDSSGHMNGAKKWDGSKWVSTAFTQDLVAGNISASKIQGGELDVNKITVKNAQNIPITSDVSLGKKLSDIKQDADGLTATVIGGGNNLLNNASDTLKTFTGQEWMRESSESDIIPTHAIDGKEVTLSAWIENPSKEAWVQMWTDKGCFKGGKIPAGESGWSQVTYTMPSDWSSWNVAVGCGDGSGEITLSYKDVKLELGPNRTAWKPSNGDIAQLKLTSDGLNAYVRGSKGSKTLESILSMDPDHSSIAQVVNGQIAAAIGTYSDGSVRIDGKALYINSHAKIDDATIKSSMIDSLEANKIKSGTLDASQITVVNLDANSITTGSLSARINDLRKFETWVVSSSNIWNFDDTKFAYGNWFLIGETSTDYVWNGPGITPYMYVTSRGSSDNSRFTVTVWKDNDPTQYQRVWNGSSWSDWVMLPNSQNLISAINLSPDSVKISGKNIELNGNTRIADGFTLSADRISAGTLNGITINGSVFTATSTVSRTDDKLQNYTVDQITTISGGGITSSGTSNDRTFNFFVNSTNFNMSNKIGQSIVNSLSVDLPISTTQSTGPVIRITTGVPGDEPIAKTIVQATSVQTPYVLVGNGGTDSSYEQGAIDAQKARTNILQTSDAWLGNLRIVGHHIRPADDKFVLVSNHAGTNFDKNGSVGFQVYGGVGLGKNTIYTASTDLYIQNGNAALNLGQSYSSANKTTIHCKNVISQVANKVSSRLSVKTDITPVSYDRALAAVQGTEMYDYRYTSDDSGQHYVSGIIDDVNPEPQYHMDDMLISKERDARIDANLLGYHHVVIQKLLERVAALEEKVK